MLSPREDENPVQVAPPALSLIRVLNKEPFYEDPALSFVAGVDGIII